MVETRAPIKAPALMGRGGAAEGEGSPAAAGGRGRQGCLSAAEDSPGGGNPDAREACDVPRSAVCEAGKRGRTNNARGSVSPQHFSYHRKASGFRDASRKRDDPELAPTKRRLAQILPERCCSFY